MADGKGMQVLFVNACVRGKASRTLRLARTFLTHLRKEAPGYTLLTHDLPTMGLRPVDAETLTLKEALCDAHDWQHPLLRPALEFATADAVVIAAPYWDLSFPSLLKVWVENMYVRNLTFVYRRDQPVGLCRGKAAAYLATAGSPIGCHDWGRAYLRDVLHTLGIPDFFSFCAEGLDLEGADVEDILLQTEMEISGKMPDFTQFLIRSTPKE